MFRIGFSLHRDITEDTFAAIGDAGLSTVEINGTGHDFAAFARWAARYGVALWSRHLPYSPFGELDISLADREVREKIVDFHTGLIKEGAGAGIKTVVLHPSTPFTEGMPRQERKKYAMDTLDKLAEAAAREGAVIAVEDMILSCLGNSAGELKELISVNDKLRVTFDVNHLFNNTHKEFVRILGSRIVHTHISDYDFVQERHWFPGEGRIPWVEVYTSLKEAGYSGVWNYEVGLTGAKMAERGRALTYTDVYNNAMEIFSGKQPHVIKVQENL